PGGPPATAHPAPHTQMPPTTTTTTAAGQGRDVLPIAARELRDTIDPGQGVARRVRDRQHGH
ncbi:MAG: hypothetical protein LC777_04610, partial [Actinobacteria bacterium]|nr:hypothetical protein [Actinomycetota bacterium]